MEHEHESADESFDLLVWGLRFMIALISFLGGVLGSCLLLLCLTDACIGLPGHPARLFPPLIGLAGLAFCRQPAELGHVAKGVFVPALWVMMHS